MFIDIFIVILSMNISEKIKEIREAKRFTQRELAENLSMTIGNYQKIEAGSVSITFDRLQQIAEIFGMSVVDIIQYPNVVGVGNGEKETLNKNENAYQRVIIYLLLFVGKWNIFFDLFYKSLCEIQKIEGGKIDDKKLDNATWADIEKQWKKLYDDSSTYLEITPDLTYEIQERYLEMKDLLIQLNELKKIM